MSKVFVQGLTCIDLVMDDGRSAYGRQTLEQIQARYPGATVAELAPWVEAKEKATWATWPACVLRLPSN